MAMIRFVTIFLYFFFWKYTDSQLCLCHSVESASPDLPQHNPRNLFQSGYLIKKCIFQTQSLFNGFTYYVFKVKNSCGVVGFHNN